jgi:hypothetical protein
LKWSYEREERSQKTKKKEKFLKIKTVMLQRGSSTRSTKARGCSSVAEYCPGLHLQHCQKKKKILNA